MSVNQVLVHSWEGISYCLRQTDVDTEGGGEREGVTIGL